MTHGVERVGIDVYDKWGEYVKSINLYKVGTKTIIAIDGADQTLDDLIMCLVENAIGQKLPMQGIDLQAVKVNSPPPPDAHSLMNNLLLKRGKYKGKTPQNALAEGQEQALAELYNIAMTTDDEEKASICSACKIYMAGELRNKLEEKDENEIEKFIRIVIPIIDENTVLKMFTYRSLDEFLLYASYEEKLLAYQGIIHSLIQRGEKKDALENFND